MLTWKRTLRTATSERFCALRDGQEVAAVDLHYLLTGKVIGTVVLMREAGWTEEQVPDLLASLDEDFLPTVELERGTLQYTVVIGDVVASYESTEEQAEAGQ